MLVIRYPGRSRNNRRKLQGVYTGKRGVNVETERACATGGDSTNPGEACWRHILRTQVPPVPQGRNGILVFYAKDGQYFGMFFWLVPGLIRRSVTGITCLLFTLPANIDQEPTRQVHAWGTTVGYSNSVHHGHQHPQTYLYHNLFTNHMLMRTSSWNLAQSILRHILKPMNKMGTRLPGLWLT